MSRLIVTVADFDIPQVTKQNPVHWAFHSEKHYN